MDHKGQRDKAKHGEQKLNPSELLAPWTSAWRAFQVPSLPPLLFSFSFLISWQSSSLVLQLHNRINDQNREEICSRTKRREKWWIRREKEIERKWYLNLHFIKIPTITQCTRFSCSILYQNRINKNRITDFIINLHIQKQMKGRRHNPREERRLLDD